MNRAFLLCTATALALYGCQAVTDAPRPVPLADAQANTDAALAVTITDLGTLGGLASEGLRINDGGQVLGRSQTASGEVHAFLWTDGTMSDLGAFYPRDLNNAGQVAGFANSHAVLWKEGQLTDLGTLGGAWSYPAGCWFGGAPVGCGSIPDAFFGDVNWPFFTRGEAINDSGQIIGESATASGERHAFVWQMGMMTDLGTLGGAWSEAKAINARGQVVGMSETGSGKAHGFLWENGTMTDLGTLEAEDINAQGQIAGSAFFPIVSPYDTIYTRHGALWDRGTVTDLGTFDDNPYHASGAEAINDRGDVMGGVDDGIHDGTVFLWRAGVMTPLHDRRLSDDYFPEAMSQRGHVAAWSFVRTCVGDNCGDDEHAILWRDGAVIDLGTLPNPTFPEVREFCVKCSHPHGINTRGDVVGTAYSSDPAYFNQAHAVLWTIRPK